MFETLLLRMKEAKRTGIFGEVDRSKFSETQKILFEFFPLSKSTNSEIQVPQKLINQFQILVISSDLNLKTWRWKSRTDASL